MWLARSSLIDLGVLAPVVAILLFSALISHHLYARRARLAARRELRLGCGFVVRGSELTEEASNALAGGSESLL